MAATEFQSNDDMQTRIKVIAADIFDVDANRIDVTMGPDDLDRWDSMNHLRLITEIEGSFSVHLSMQQIQQVKTLQDLARFVSEST